MAGYKSRIDNKGDIRPQFSLKKVKNGGREGPKIISLQDLALQLKNIPASKGRLLGISALTSILILATGCNQSPSASSQPTSPSATGKITHVPPTTIPIRPSTGIPTPTQSPTPVTSPTHPITATPTSTPTPIVVIQRVENSLIDSGLIAHQGSINSVTFNKKGDLLASGGDDNKIRLWRISDGSLANILDAGYKVRGLAFSPDGSFIFSFGGNTISVWRLSNGSLERKKSFDHLNNMVLSPDGNFFAVSGESTVELRKASDGVLVQTFKRDLYAGVRSIAFSQDGNTLATGYDDNSLCLWKVTGGRLLHTLVVGQKIIGISNVTFSPDGKLIASCIEDNFANRILQLWRVDEEILVNTWKTSTYAQSQDSNMAFSPDGSLIATADNYSHNVSLWRVKDGELVRQLNYATNGFAFFESLAFSPDGHFIAIGTGNGHIYLWDITDTDQYACTVLFDPSSTSSNNKAYTYRVTDAYGVTRTYTLPCGTPVPPGAICVCNCIPGTYVSPTPTKTSTSSGGGSGYICTCNKVCTCIPVPYKYCFVMFK